jgi:K+ transport systems, NAD-binding component
MNILILGAGEVGFNIARRLAMEGSNVVVVDTDARLLQRVSDSMDVKTVHGSASLPSVLERAGAADADLLIAATTNDEVNMLACQVAHSLFKVPTKMARLREAEYVNCKALFGRDDLPIDLVISPEREAAKAIIKRFQASSAADVQEFAGGRVSLVGLRIPPKSELAGMSLMDSGEVTKGLPLYIVAHEHNQKWQTPKGDTVLLAGDMIYAAMASRHVSAFLEIAGLKQEESHKHVMIIGGGHIGYIVAEELEQMGLAPKLIEYDEARAEWLAERLGKTIVIHGDALDRDLLEEESIGDMDHFLAVTNDDEVNILSSLVAKKYQVPHIITLVNRGVYSDLMRQIGLDVTISPRLTTAAYILRHVRRGRILGMSTLGDGSLEVIDVEALETSDILNKPLRRIKFPPDTVVGAIVRGDEVIIPNGDTRIIPHDHVMIVTTVNSLRAVEKLFEVHLEFF